MRWLNRIKETSRNIPVTNLGIHALGSFRFITDTDDPEGARAVLFHVPDLGDFWCVADEAAMNEVSGSGLPYLMPEDLAFITGGTTRHDRFNRLCEAVARRHPCVNEIVKAFNGEIKSIRRINQ